MGISGLLPLLKSIQKPCNLRQFAGQTLGVDAYGWLHRGTVACAMDLALGKPTTKFVDFAMHRVRMLIHFGVTPYLVFDGDYLPSKAATESERNKKREDSRRQGLELLRLGKTTQAHLELQKAVDVTPEMARQLIDELKASGVQYVVAPYEADAQLVYLERKGIIDGILSEDSDLLVFGAKCLLTKLDQYGECIMINRKDFAACKDISLVGWSDTEFRRMAILSGCDYLPSMSKMGLKTAYRLVRKHKTLEKILRAVQFDGQFRVPPGYLGAFQQAEMTFLHQHVFCPVQKSLVRLTDLEDGVDLNDLPFIGKPLTDDIVSGVASGDLHPMTKEAIIVQCPKRMVMRTPLHPARNHRTPMDSAEVKKHPSIDSFFKPKRTPLAELDPNSFTPSPSQQRVLRENRGSWIAQSAPAHHLGLQANTPTTYGAAPSPASAPTPRSAMQSRIPKRIRLCSDSAEGSPLSTVDKPADAKSRFFPLSRSVESPSVRNGSRTRTRRRADVNIWSDDSIEDVMADLPDISDRQQSPKRAKISVFQEVDRAGACDASDTAAAQYPTPPCSEGALASGNGLSEQGSKTLSIMPAPGGAGRRLDMHIGRDLKALRTKFAYKSSPHQNMSTMVSTAKVLTDIEASKASSQPCKSSSRPDVAARRSTPLQRLGVEALRRTQSEPAANCAQSTSNQLNTTHEDVQVASGHTEAATESCLTVDVSKALGARGTQGSEDYIVPDSEEEADGDEAPILAGQGIPSTLDLSNFLFTGS